MLHNKTISVLTHNIYESIAAHLPLRDLTAWRSTCRLAYTRGKNYEDTLVHSPHKLLQEMLAMNKLEIFYLLQYFFPLNGAHEKTLATLARDKNNLAAIALYALIAPVALLSEAKKAKLKDFHQSLLDRSFPSDNALMLSIEFLFDEGDAKTRINKHLKGFLNLRGTAFDNLNGLCRNETALNYNEAQFYTITIEYAKFKHCSFVGADFYKCNLLSNEFTNSNLAAATFERCRLSGTTIKYCNLSDTKFKLNKMGFYQQDWEETHDDTPHAPAEISYCYYNNKTGLPLFFKPHEHTLVKLPIKPACTLL